MNALDRATHRQEAIGAPPVSKPDGPTSPTDEAKRAQYQAMCAGMGMPLMKASEISDG